MSEPLTQLELELVEPSTAAAADAAADDETAPAEIETAPLRQIGADGIARELLLGSLNAGRPEYLTLDELGRRYAAQVAELRTAAAAEPEGRKRRAAERYADGVARELESMLASSAAWYAAAPLREQQIAQYAALAAEEAA